jgi:glycosyltransferase involved in cell wall biosynthesis
MRVLLYADFRSPHAQGWRAGLESAGVEVLGVSSEPVDDGISLNPSGGLSAARQRYVETRTTKTGLATVVARRASELQFVHSVVQVSRSASRQADVRAAVERFKPELLHGLRLPYEGITALAANASVPTVVSSWGQDFVPQASSDPLLRHWLRKYLPAAAGFHYDSTTDLDRALRYGVRSDVPTLHAAGNFGVDESMFHPRDAKVPGLVSYVRKATPTCNYFGFIEAALRLIRTTDATFVGVGLARLEDEVTRRFGVYDHSRLRLIGELGGDDFAQLVRTSQVVVSPSYSDGMPVSILGAIASGAHIVAGDLPQFRELTARGVDMHLIDPSQTDAIERGIASQLSAPLLGTDSDLPKEHSRARNCTRVVDFYDTVLGRAT